MPSLTVRGEALYRFLESVLLDYVPFIVLLLGLFVVAGGIALKGTLVGTTKVNAILLLIGTVLASWIGTTGAAMLLIRPLIRANAWREKKVHVIVFFIFLVANMGGCLTPLGDPPLFMGFQRGVPFTWTFHLLPILLLNLVLVFGIFIFIDRKFYKKEIAAGRSPQNMIGNDTKEPIRIEGAHNLIFIAMIILGVVASGVLPQMFDFFADGAGIHVYDAVVFPYAVIVADCSDSSGLLPVSQDDEKVYERTERIQLCADRRSGKAVHRYFYYDDSGSGSSEGARRSAGSRSALADVLVHRPVVLLPGQYADLSGVSADSRRSRSGRD